MGLICLTGCSGGIIMVIFLIVLIVLFVIGVLYYVFVIEPENEQNRL